MSTLAESNNTYNCHLLVPAIAFGGTRSLHFQQTFWIFSRMSSPFLFLEPQTVFQRPQAWAGKRAPSLEPSGALLAYFFANYPSSVSECERNGKQIIEANLNHINVQQCLPPRSWQMREC